MRVLTGQAEPEGGGTGHPSFDGTVIISWVSQISPLRMFAKFHRNTNRRTGPA